MDDVTMWDGTWYGRQNEGWLVEVEVNFSPSNVVFSTAVALALKLRPRKWLFWCDEAQGVDDEHEKLSCRRTNITQN